MLINLMGGIRLYTKHWCILLHVNVNGAYLYELQSCLEKTLTHVQVHIAQD